MTSHTKHTLHTLVTIPQNSTNLIISGSADYPPTSERQKKENLLWYCRTPHSSQPLTWRCSLACPPSLLTSPCPKTSVLLLALCRTVRVCPCVRQVSLLTASASSVDISSVRYSWFESSSLFNFSVFLPSCVSPALLLLLLVFLSGLRFRDTLHHTFSYIDPLRGKQQAEKFHSPRNKPSVKNANFLRLNLDLCTLSLPPPACLAGKVVGPVQWVIPIPPPPDSLHAQTSLSGPIG